MSNPTLQQQIHRTTVAQNIVRTLELLDEVDRESRRAANERGRAQLSKNTRIALQFNKLADFSNTQVKKATLEIRKIQIKHMRHYLKLMEDKKNEIRSAKEKNLRSSSNKSPTAIKEANKQLDMKLDSFILDTMMEARKNKLLQGSEFLEKIENYKQQTIGLGRRKRKHTKKNKKKKTKKRKLSRKNMPKRVAK